MNNKKRSRWAIHLQRTITVVFAISFCLSFISINNIFATANIFTIEDAKLTELSEGVEGDITSFDGLEIKTNVTFHKIGDTAKYTLVIRNDSDKDQLINYISDNSNNDYLSYTYNNFENTLIKSNETFNFVVTVEYKTAVTNLSEREQLSNVKFFINYTEGVTEIPLVPDTSGSNTVETLGDAIKTNTITIIVSATGLVICIIFAVRRNKKYPKIVAGLILAVSAITTATTVKAATIETNNITFTGNFNLADKLVVTYVINSEEKTEIIPYGSRFTKEIPSDEDFDVTKWTLEDGTDFDPETPVNHDLKLIAKYERTTLHVNFMGNGLKFQNDSEKNIIAINNGCHEEPAPQVSSHTSNIDDNGNTIKDDDENDLDYPEEEEFIEPFRFTGASSLRIDIKYSIEDDYDHLWILPGYYETMPEENSETDSNDIIHISKGYNGRRPSIFTDSFIINGDSVTFNFISDQTVGLYGYYATITPLDENGNEIPSDQTISVCGKYIASGEYLEPEHNEKQEFFGWSESSSKENLEYTNKAEVIDNLQGELGETKTLYAVWLNKHDVVYNPNGGDGESVTNTEYGGSKIALKSDENLNYHRENYDFLGWSEDKNATTPTYTEFNLSHAYLVPDNTDTTTLYAIWRKQHIIHYNGNGSDSGEVADQYISVDSQEALRSNSFVREHYDFLGWSEDKNATESSYEYEENDNFLSPSEPGETTFYAVWRKQHQIIFDANGGQGTMTDQWESIYTKAKLNANQFERGNYDFTGWSEDKNTETPRYEDEELFTIPDEAGGTTTLYAIWKLDCKTFATDSWATIASNINDNPTYYAYGCEKEVEMDINNSGTTKSYTVRLANTSTPEVCSVEGYSQTACGTVIEFVDMIGDRQINSKRTNVGGWKASGLVTWLNGEFYNKLPADLKSVIIPTYPIVSGDGSETNVSPNITSADTTKNKIYLPSALEIGDNNYYANKKDPLRDTRTFDYYAQYINNNDALKAARIKKASKTSTSGDYWWLRDSAYNFANEQAYFIAVWTDGSTTNFSANASFANVAPTFRIGTN